MQATAAAMRDQFNVFGANQNIMRRHVEELSDDIRFKLSKVMKQLQTFGSDTKTVTINSPSKYRAGSPSPMTRQRSGSNGRASPANRKNSDGSTTSSPSIRQRKGFT